MARRYASMRERILKNSRINMRNFTMGTPCRDWTGATFPPPWPDAPREKCYGRIGVRFKRGPRKGKGRSTQAHRESAKAFKPWLKTGTKNIVRHLCNRPICVQPEHLTGSEQRMNVLQCVAEGRHKTPFRRTNGERYAAKNAT